MRILKTLTIIAGLATVPVAAQATSPVIGPAITNDARVPWFESMLRDTEASPGPLQKARTLVSQGRYSEADVVLNDVRDATRTNGALLQKRFLKGVVALGQNNPESARRLFKKAASMRRSEHPGALSGLALAEIQLGDEAAARRIRDRLQTRSDACDSTCSSSTALENALGVVDKALLAEPNRRVPAR